MRTTLITGTSRGLGLEFATQYARAGWRVFATCRDPESAEALQEVRRRYPDTVYVHALDVGDEAQIERLGELLEDESLDLLINNAGWCRRQVRLAGVDYESWEQSMRVNAYATFKMAHVFLRQVARSRKRTIVTLSSMLGSISRNESGTLYAYRASKAAANMIVKTLAVDLSPRGVLVVSLSPGWVRTDMGGPDAPISGRESVRGLRKVIAGLKPADSGRFFSYDGTEIPW